MMLPELVNKNLGLTNGAVVVIGAVAGAGPVAGAGAVAEAEEESAKD